jgi:hypothetical protein
MIVQLTIGELVRVRRMRGPRILTDVFRTGPDDKLVAEVRGPGIPPTRIVPAQDVRPYQHKRAPR